jgi:hypothetical protein
MTRHRRCLTGWVLLGYRLPTRPPRRAPGGSLRDRRRPPREGPSRLRRVAASPPAPGRPRPSLRAEDSGDFARSEAGAGVVSGRRQRGGERFPSPQPHQTRRGSSPTGVEPGRRAGPRRRSCGLQPDSPTERASAGSEAEGTQRLRHGRGGAPRARRVGEARVGAHLTPGTPRGRLPTTTPTGSSLRDPNRCPSGSP